MTGRPVGLTQDAGWEIGVSRTVPARREDVWDLLVSPRGLRAWRGDLVEGSLAEGATYRTADGTTGEVRGLRPLDRIRLTWRPPHREAHATIQVALVERQTGCSVRFHAEHLASAEERETMRGHWRGVLDRLETLLGP